MHIWLKKPQLMAHLTAIKFFIAHNKPSEATAIMEQQVPYLERKLAEIDKEGE